VPIAFKSIISSAVYTGVQGGKKGLKICYMYMFEDSIMKPTKHCLKRGRESWGSGNIGEGANLFKLQCTHEGITTMKSPPIINVYEFKRLITIEKEFLCFKSKKSLNKGKSN
jgi:hypothetical protein